jgi:hypothetical protein
LQVRGCSSSFARYELTDSAARNPAKIQHPKFSFVRVRARADAKSNKSNTRENPTGFARPPHMGGLFAVLGWLTDHLTATHADPDPRPFSGAGEVKAANAEPRRLTL